MTLRRPLLRTTVFRLVLVLYSLWLCTASLLEPNNIASCYSQDQTNGISESQMIYETQDVVFVSRLDQSEQRYVLMAPKSINREQPQSLLVAFHGHGSDRWQFVKDGRDECRAARDAAMARKMIYVAPDYRAKTSWIGPLS